MKTYLFSSLLIISLLSGCDDKNVQKTETKAASKSSDVVINVVTYVGFYNNKTVSLKFYDNTLKVISGNGINDPYSDVSYYRPAGPIPPNPCKPYACPPSSDKIKIKGGYLTLTVYDAAGAISELKWQFNTGSEKLALSLSKAEIIAQRQ